MTKKNVLKLATAALVFLLAANVVNAQSYPAGIQHTGDVGNYVEVDANVTHQTVGLGFTLYVAPDPVYSPDYSTQAHDGSLARGTGINASSEWQWVWGASFADGVAAGDIPKPWTAAQNWVELTPAMLPGAGASRTFWVSERFGGAACADATGQSHTVNVIDVPTAVMIGLNTGTAWNVEDGAIEFSLCDDGHQDDLQITFTETGAPFNEYAYSVTVTQTGYDINGGIVVGPDNVTATFGRTVNPVIGDFEASPASYNIPAMTFAQDGGTDVRTKYEFTLATIASRTSTVSHVRAGASNTLYTVADQVVTYWLNLPPVTGPIYHIPDNYSF